MREFNTPEEPRSGNSWIGYVLIGIAVFGITYSVARYLKEKEESESSPKE